MNYPFFIARRYFRRGRGGYLFLTNLFAIISVAVGVASLILVLGVMNGFDRDLKTKIIGVFPPVEIQIPSDSDFSQVESRVNSFPEVVAVAPFSETQAIFRSKSFLTAGLLRAIEPEKEDAVTGFQKFLISDSKNPSPLGGEGKSEGETGEVGWGGGLVLGSELAQNLRVDIGDQLEIITGFGVKTRTLPVVGIFRTGLYHFDVTMAFVPLSLSQGFFPTGVRPEALGIKIKDIYKAKDFSLKVARELGPSFRVESWISKNEILFSALALERRAMAIILILIIFVAGFNIATCLMITVWRKSKEIGVLRSMGVSAGGIQAIFLWMGFLTALWGVGIGLATGLSLAYIGDHYQLIKLPGYVYDLSYLPIKVQVFDIIWITVVSFGIALAASIFPAREAARVAPAVTLRSE
ncbi:MAG: ABC transporter permease [Candidatus Ratteibacteria bacterium]|jgi:lipoprotein-releasing system permease protein